MNKLNSNYFSELCSRFAMVHSSTNVPFTTDQLPRDVKVGIAIETHLNRIFLAMFCRRFDSARPVAHVRHAIVDSHLYAVNIIRGITLNKTEIQVLTQLNELVHAILNESVVQRTISSVDTIVALLRRIDDNRTTTNTVIENMYLILAMANQTEYTSSFLTIPYIRIDAQSGLFFKASVNVETPFHLERSVSANNPKFFFFRLFEGLILRQNDFSVLQSIASAITIGILPDIQSGIGLTCFPYEAVLASPLLRAYCYQVKGDILHRGQFYNALLVKNAWIVQFENARTQIALEADYSDTVSPGDEEADSATDDAETESEEQTTEDTDDATSESGDEPLTPNQDDPSEDGTDTVQESKPVLLGINLALPKNETLDSYMYKFYAAKYIDNVIEFNHENLPLETITLLTKWKSLLLFLTDAEETQKLFKDLKIKMK